jgi:autotransporter-associated beta strand protein
MLTWQTNGSLTALADLDLSNDITVATGTGTGGLALTTTANRSLTNKISGIISGSGGLRLNTAGATAYPANLSNNFAGGFYLQQGTLAVATIGSVGNDSPLGTSGIVYVGTATNANSSAIFKYLGDGETTDKTIWLGGIANTTFASVDQSGLGVLKFTADVVATNLGPKTLILDGSSAGEGEVAGVISNSSSSTVSLVKRGTGTWTLSGSNVFTGPTSVQAGTLVVSGSLPTNSVSISNGATVAGLGRLQGDVALSGILDPGTEDLKGPMTVDGSLLVEAEGAVNLTIDSLANYDRVAGTVAVTINGAINVAASADYVPASGNIFQLFNGPVSGTPTLDVTPLTNTNYVWVTNNFPSTGQISVTNNSPVLTPYGSWLTNYPGITNFPGGASNTNGMADPDGDGLINELEFAFDGNPTVGTPALLNVVQSEPDAVFSFLASTNPGAVSYLVQSTTNLRTGWSNNIDVTASIIDSPNQTNPVIPLFPSYLRREFSVPQNGNSFYRVQATILP